jgi:putative NADH-flavin reductase
VINTTQPIAIFGGTGTVGAELVRTALTSGHRVRALVRTPTAIETASDNLDVIVGDVRDRDTVTRMLEGCEAVLSTLGARRGDDPTTRTIGATNNLNAMREHQIRRLIVMGGFHFRMPGDPGNLGQKLITPIIRIAPGIDLDDSLQLARLVVGSDRDWTFLRSPRVSPGRPSRGYRTGTLRLGPWSSVTPGDIAAFMLQCLEDDTQIGQAPMICAR